MMELTRLRQLAGLAPISEEEKLDKALDKIEKSEDEHAEKPAASVKAPAETAGKPAQAAVTHDEKGDKEQHAKAIEFAKTGKLAVDKIRTAVRNYVDEAHQKVKVAGEPESSLNAMRAELNRLHDVVKVNLHHKHGFPFQREDATDVEKQEYEDIFKLSNNLSHTIRNELGHKKSTDIEWLKP